MLKMAYHFQPIVESDLSTEATGSVWNEGLQTHQEDFLGWKDHICRSAGKSEQWNGTTVHSTNKEIWGYYLHLQK